MTHVSVGVARNIKNVVEENEKVRICPSSSTLKNTATQKV